MTVEIYSKEGCKICTAAKEKMTLMGVDYREHDLAYYIQPHAGWREDGSTEIMTAHTFYGSLPLIRVGETILDYAGAMKAIRQHWPKKATVAPVEAEACAV